MYGWIIVNGFLYTSKFSELTDLFMEAAKEHEIDLFVKTNSECFLGMFELTTEKKPDFVLFWDKDILLAKYFAACGIPVYNSAEGIEICDDNFQMVRTEMVSLPVIGQVAAGQPILAEENIESYFPVPAEVVPHGESFILNVKGDSMINAGIFNGDQIFVNACNTARNGEIVVALIDDSATVKTFYKEDGHIRLQPENDTMDPIIVNDCQILGKVFGIFRIL